jgi:DNA polymerase III alpha subunit
MWTENNTQEQLITGVLRHGPDILEHCQTSADLTKYIDRINQEHLDYPQPRTIDPEQWFIPRAYRDMDIEEWIVAQCPEENYDRVLRELELFRSNGMVPVLRCMKYVVDTLRENKVVWGVGRGSSVASYVLYLIGVHKIDSVKYSIPIEEFFKGE